MNQIARQTDNTPTTAISMTTGEGGSKLAPQTMAEVVQFAKVMCTADIALPRHLRGNAGACMAVAMQAMEWNLSPFAVASKSYAVNGAIAYEAQLIAAVVNTRSGIKGRLKYKFEGEGHALKCTVSGILDDEECVYTSPAIGSITTKNSPLWKSDPQQQLGYFSARSWARRHCPEVILGVYDRDEAEEFRGPENAKNITPAPTIHDRLSAAKTATYEPTDTQEGFDREYVAQATETASVSHVEPDIEYTAPPSSPAAVDADHFPGDLQEGVDVSSPASAPSTNPLLVECCRNLMNIAIDESIERPNRRGVLEAAKDNWKEILPASDHEILKRFFMSADQIIKGNAQYSRVIQIYAEMLEVSEKELGA